MGHYIAALLLASFGALAVYLQFGTGWLLIGISVFFLPVIWNRLAAFLPFRELGLIRGILSFSLIAITTFQITQNTREAGMRGGDQAGPPPGIGAIMDRSDPSTGRYTALLFAAQNYEPPYPDLDHPIEDALRLKQTLEQQYGFVDVLLVEDPKEQTFADEFKKLRKRTNEEDNVLIFYAGHGNQHWATNNEGAWIPSDATTHETTWFSMSDLKRNLEGLKAKHVLLVVDACFGGSLLTAAGKMRSTLEETPEESMASNYYSRRSFKAITSGAREPVYDESLFMQNFIALLNSYTGEKYLASMLHQQLIRKLGEAGYVQTPLHAPLSGMGDEGGDFVFVKRDISR